jgi:hypothetical protein
MRQQIEADLSRRLDNTPTPDNQVGGVFLTLASLLFVLMTGVVLLLLALQLLRPQ